MSSYFGLSRLTRVSGLYRACQRRSLVAIAVLGLAAQAGMSLPAAFGQNLTVSSGTTTISSGATTYGQVLVANNSGQTATLSLTGGTISATESSIGAGGTGTANVAGGVWNAGAALYVGLNAGSQGTLNVTSGTVTNTTATLGYYGGSSGAATVSGGAWNFGDALFVGRDGAGTLEVTGGTVNSNWSYLGVNAGGVGTATVSSGGSWIHSGGLNVGNRGTGTLTVGNGGLVTTTDRLSIGNDNQGTGGNGTLTIQGGGHVTVNGSLNYGNGLGTHVLNLGGTLQIGTGGTSGSLDIPSLNYSGKIIFNRSDNSTFAGNLTGSGNIQKVGAGTLTLTGSNAIGAIYETNSAVHDGTLKLENGGSLTYTDQFFHVGQKNGDTGTLEIGNGGLFTTNDTLILGETTGATGTLKVTAGGSYNGRNVAVGSNGGTGTIEQTGGTVSGNLLSVGQNSSGTATISAGTMTMNQINIGAAGSMTVNGTVNSLTGPVTVGFGGTLGGAGTIVGNTSIAGGHILGDPAGLQTIDGLLDYKNDGQGAATAFWNLVASDSTSPASYGHVQVSGDLGFRDTTLLMLAFDSAGSTVAWSDAFWSQSEQWTVYGVGGTLSGFDRLSIDPSNWLDSNGRAFGTYLAGSSFSLSRAGNDIVLNYNTAAVPEIDPSSFGSALAMAMGSLAMLERRARRAFGRQTTV